MTTTRAWAWVAHLRSGGVTPWSAFDGSAEADGRYLPGAQQLELLRRLNEAGRATPALVERVVLASAPGRGRPDLELVGAGPERRFGPLPVDPITLPGAELLRVATGLLAQDVVATGLPEEAPVRVRRTRKRYELAGDRFVASAWTDALVAGGRPPGGAGRAVHVLGADLPTLLAHAWTARCFAHGGPPWPEFLARIGGRDRLPRRIDLPAVAERFLARPHTGRVSVVLDLAALPRLVGVRRLPVIAEVSAEAGELARLVGIALSLLVTPPEQAALLHAVLRPRLAGLAGPPPAVPLEQRDWVEDTAARLHRRLSRAGYPVVGDPGAVMPRWRPLDESGPSPLDLAIRLLLEDRR